MNQSEIEKAVLGCILLDYKRVLPDVMSIISEADFYEPLHRDIYAICLLLEKENKAIDSVSVYERMSGKTSAAYISGLSDGFATTAYVKTYCEQIKEVSKLRQLSLITQIVKNEIKEGLTFNEIAGNLMSSIAKLDSDKINEFINAKDVIFDIYQDVKKGKTEGLKTGFSKIDKITHGLQNSNLITLAADTGKGKTAMALNIISNILSHGKTVVLYSLEMSYSENIKRLLSIISETNSNVSDEHLVDTERNRRLEGCNFIMENNFIINDKSQNVDSICATAKSKMNDLRRNGGKIDFIVVDYVQILQGTGKAENRQGEVSGIAQRLKTLAKELNIPVMILSQVNAEYEKDKRQLRLNDLRESKAIGHASDVVMIINKDKADEFRDPFFTLNILKNRHGALFFMKMEFIKEYTKFKELEEENYGSPEWQKN